MNYINQAKDTITITEPKSVVETSAKPWVVLVVDDEQGVLDVTKEVLQEFQMQGRGLQIESATSYEEAKTLYDNFPDAAIILIDCMMEKNTSGLEFVRYIREIKKNRHTQLVLRTGQPDFAPEKEVLLEYEVNDYLPKAEVTSKKLYYKVISYLRNYENLATIRAQKQEIRKMNSILTEKNGELVALNDLKDHAFLLVSNELLPPLSTIKRSVTKLLNNDDLVAYQREALQAVLKKTAQLHHLSSAFFSTHLENETLRLRCETFDLIQLMGELMPQLITQSVLSKRSGGPEISYSPCTSKLSVFADPDRIKQAVLHLVKAIAKHTQAGPITLSCSQCESVAQINISASVDYNEEKKQQLQSFFESVNKSDFASIIEADLFVAKKIADLHCQTISFKAEEGSNICIILHLNKRQSKHTTLSNIFNR